MAGPNNLYIGGGVTLWVAPVGTAFPDVDTTPPVAWYQVGTDGSKSYSDDGVTIRRNVSIERVRALGTTLVRKAAISEADVEIELNVMDMDPAQVLLAMGGLETAVTEVAAAAATSGTSTIVVPTSPTPVEKALLMRIEQSFAGSGFITQIQVQDAIQAGGGEAVLSKSSVMQWQHLWTCLEPASGDAVEIIYQTAAPTG